MRSGIALVLLCLASAAPAETVIATRTLRAQEVISAQDLVLVAEDVAGALDQLDGLAGLETRRVLYAGRPVYPGDLGPPALVERNGLVTLIYDRGGLQILTEARALARAGEGETIRVMNLESRRTVMGTVLPDGSVMVQ